MTNIGGTSADKGMVRVMGIVGFALFMLAVCIGLVANILGGDDEVEGDALMRNALVQRLEPVGRVRTVADAPPAGEVVAVADTGDGAAMRSGEELVQGACAACHAAGVAGAPMLGDEAAWAERRELGLETLVGSVINGKGSMPARGGSDYSDEEIELAVQHIALFEVEEPAAEAPAAEEAAAAPAAEGAAAGGVAAAPAADEAAAVPADAAASADADEVLAADATPAAESAAVTPENDLKHEGLGEVSAANDMQADDRIETEGATEGVTEEAAGNVDAAVRQDIVDDQPVAVEAAAALVVGEAPAELPDHVKTTVDGVCAGCHIAGVANAPKIGDTEAWQERADAGLAALTASVINGKGVMPARGGSNLTDAEIPIAIQYLMSK